MDSTLCSFAEMTVTQTLLGLGSTAVAQNPPLLFSQAIYHIY